MPKIIENVREELLAETKRQIGDRGYAKTTIRSVADACGIGVGTVYNHFPTKKVEKNRSANFWFALLFPI